MLAAAMRILTDLARSGLELARPVTSDDGMPLLGRGTRLSERHLCHLHAAEVRVIDVADDGTVEDWEHLPTMDGFVDALDRRFAAHGAQRRMEVLKRAIRKTYLDFLLDLAR
jgi:hypothetical protein